MTVRSVGVEEELLLVEPGTGKPLAVAETALRTVDAGDQRQQNPDEDAGESLEFELQRQQLETSTKPCFELSELGGELRRGRSLVAEVAVRVGARVTALATSPDEGVAVIDRIRPWLPVLLALSANSPFWQGQDSAYASFRYQAWTRWPTAGPTDTFGSAEAYRETVQRMVRTGTLLDAGMVYFDARLSENYPTVEIRVSDVCLYADDAVLIAALARALVETEARHWRAGSAVPAHRIETLRLGTWRASRSGLDDVLLDPHTGIPEPAPTVVHVLLDHVRDALDEAGDADVVTELLGAVLDRGNGAAFQRNAHRDSSLASVIESTSAVTAR
jgi:glutamate---cysteine ligase / carboxylate-amine ligase